MILIWAVNAGYTYIDVAQKWKELVFLIFCKMLCSVVFHALILKLSIQTSLSVAPKLQVSLISTENCPKFQQNEHIPALFILCSSQKKNISMGWSMFNKWTILCKVHAPMLVGDLSSISLWVNNSLIIHRSSLYAMISLVYWAKWWNLFNRTNHSLVSVIYQLVR